MLHEMWYHEGCSVGNIWGCVTVVLVCCFSVDIWKRTNSGQTPHTILHLLEYLSQWYITCFHVLAYFGFRLIITSIMFCFEVLLWWSKELEVAMCKVWAVQWMCKTLPMNCLRSWVVSDCCHGEGLLPPWANQALFSGGLPLGVTVLCHSIVHLLLPCGPGHPSCQQFAIPSMSWMMWCAVPLDMFAPTGTAAHSPPVLLHCAFTHATLLSAVEVDGRAIV
jgi:hypothetical protein